MYIEEINENEEKLPEQIVIDFNTSRKKYLQSVKMNKHIKRQKVL